MSLRGNYDMGRKRGPEEDRKRKREGRIFILQHRLGMFCWHSITRMGPN